MIEKDAISNLIEALDALKSSQTIDSKFKYFITDGTLLGFIREGNFIKHDTDIDLGIFGEEVNFNTLGRIINNFLAFKFELHHFFGVFGKHFELTFKKRDIKVDIFFYFPDNINKIRKFTSYQNGYRNGESDVIYYFYPEDYLKIDNIILSDEVGKLPIPEDPIKFLEFKYGPNWREEDKNWDWRFSPKNILNN